MRAPARPAPPQPTELEAALAKQDLMRKARARLWAAGFRDLAPDVGAALVRRVLGGWDPFRGQADSDAESTGELDGEASDGAAGAAEEDGAEASAWGGAAGPLDDA